MGNEIFYGDGLNNVPMYICCGSILSKWFKFYFPLFLGMVIYDNEFETKENKISTKDKTEPQHI